MKLSRLALAVALAPALPIFAQQPADEALRLPEQVITSGRQAEPRSQAVAATTVFTRQDIERLQPRDVIDLLQRTPGLSVQRSGGRGSLTGIFLRGTSTAQTLVLVDGQRLAGASSGTASLEHLNVDQIERIEVVRGGRSALYGSDAIGGVIHVFTRQGEPGLTPRLRVGVGSHGSFERTLGVSGGDADTRFDLSGSLDERRGFERTDLPGSQDSGYRNKALSFTLSHAFSQQLSGGLSVMRNSGNSEYDYPLSPAAFAEVDFEVSSASGYLQAQLNERWASRVEIGHSEDRQLTSDPYGGSRFNTYRDQLGWINTLNLDDHQQVLLGADWYEDRLNSSEDFSQRSRWNHAFFAQHRYQAARFATEVGLRHDKNQQFGNQNSWNVAGTWHLDPQNDLILSYSEAFRAPTFNDLYYPDDCYPGWGCTVYANPDLAPETARSYELQWRSRLAPSTEAEISLYRTLIRDAIVTNNALDGNEMGSETPYRPENIDKARINGLEAVLRQEWAGGWLAQGSYSLVDARNAGSGGNRGNRLARRPQHTVTMDIDRRFGAYNLGATWLLASHSYDDLANEQQIPGYGVLGIRAGWQAQRDLRLDLTVDNLLDRDYYQARGTAYDQETFAQVPFRYRDEGRTAMLSMTWTPTL